MEMMAIGFESLEAAMNVGAMVVDQIGNIGQVSAEETPITCEICRCEWA